MLSLDNHFLGTYGKSFLVDWVVIADMIRDKTYWIKETLAADGPTKENQLLSDQKIDDALNGPYQLFFKIHLNAYAKISKLEAALTISQDEQFKESEHAADITLGLPKFLIERNDFSSLKELRDQLNTQTKAHYEALEQANMDWKNTVIAELKVVDIQLADVELQELNTNQPATELNDRFINLNLPAPKLPKNPFDFAQYWMIKTVLAIHSTLSRLQLPHTEKEIDGKLKSMRHTFKKIQDAEKTLLDTQSSALKKLLTPITPPAEK